jgi:lysyl endopeptidase
MNIRLLHFLCLCAAIVLSCAPQLFAQQSTSIQRNATQTIQPISFEPNLSKELSPKSLQSEKIKIPSLAKLQKEDRAHPSIHRFAAPIQTNLDLLKDGEATTLADGSRIVRMKVSLQNALGAVFLFDKFYLPKGATLHAYTEDKKQVLGPFSWADNSETGVFTLGLMQGETTILEYFEPKNAEKSVQLHIFRIDYAYNRTYIEPSKDAPSTYFSPLAGGFGMSKTCNTNINCTNDELLQNAKKGIVRIMMVLQEGTGWCTGALINNVKKDAKPYILTGFHCQYGYTPKYDFWKFDFNYEGTACDNPAVEPKYSTLVGCKYRAGKLETDFLLLELDKSIPSFFDAVFLGWDRRANYLPDRSFLIHHPTGDIKKLSIDTDPATVFAETIKWNNTVTTPASHHFRLQFDKGTYELGSSGSPMLDNTGKIVGQLNGGYASCDQTIGYYGRLALSWDEGTTSATRLKDWLDPDNTGATSVDVMNAPTLFANVIIHIVDINGQAIEMADTRLKMAIFPTDVVPLQSAANAFTFPKGVNIELKPSNILKPTNGVSTFDLVLLQKHILATDTFTLAYQPVAADSDRSGTVTVKDIVQLRKLLLRIDANNFLDQETWRFFLLPVAGFDTKKSKLTNYAESVKILGLENDVEVFFMAVKLGDINGNATP